MLALTPGYKHAGSNAAVQPFPGEPDRKSRRLSDASTPESSSVARRALQSYPQNASKQLLPHELAAVGGFPTEPSPHTVDSLFHQHLSGDQLPQHFTPTQLKPPSKIPNGLNQVQQLPFPSPHEHTFQTHSVGQFAITHHPQEKRNLNEVVVDQTNWKQVFADVCEILNRRPTLLNAMILKIKALQFRQGSQKLFRDEGNCICDKLELILKKKKWNKAITAVQAIIDLIPKMQKQQKQCSSSTRKLHSLHMRAYCLKSRTLLEAKRYPQACAVAEEIISLMPDKDKANPPKRGSYYQQALTCKEYCILHIDSSKRKLKQISIDSQQWRIACRLSKKILKRKPHSFVALVWRIQALQFPPAGTPHHYEKYESAAMAVVDKLKSLYPQNKWDKILEAADALINSFAFKCKNKKIAKSFVKQVRPSLAQAHVFKALALVMLERNKEALSFIEKMIDPDANELLEYKCYLPSMLAYKAESLRGLGKPEEAMPLIDQALAAVPNCIWALNCKRRILTDHLIEQGNAEGAQPYIKEMLSLDPNCLRYLTQKFQMLKENNRLDEAFTIAQLCLAACRDKLSVMKSNPCADQNQLQNLLRQKKQWIQTIDSLVFLNLTLQITDTAFDLAP